MGHTTQSGYNILCCRDRKYKLDEFVDLVPTSEAYIILSTLGASCFIDGNSKCVHTYTYHVLRATTTRFIAYNTSARAGTSSFLVEIDDAHTCGRLESAASPSAAILNEALEPCLAACLLALKLEDEGGERLVRADIVPVPACVSRPFAICNWRGRKDVWSFLEKQQASKTQKRGAATIVH